jgi:hypothetical protein
LNICKIETSELDKIKYDLDYESRKLSFKKVL